MKRRVQFLCVRRQIVASASRVPQVRAAASTEAWERKPRPTQSQSCLSTFTSRTRRYPNTVSSSRKLLFSTTAGDVRSVWHQTTDRLVDIPAGNMGDKHWNEAHNAILYWSEQGDHLQYALRLMDRLIEEEETISSTVPPNFFQTSLLNLILNRWRQEIAEKAPYNELLSPAAITERLQRYHNTSQRIQPDTQSFAMVVDAISSLPYDQDRLQVANELLRWQVIQGVDHAHLRPNVFSFSSLMNVWVKSGRQEAPERVQSLLDDMRTLQEEQPDWEVSPNVVTYGTAIDTWAKAGNVERVENLFMLLHEEHSRTGSEELRPNLRTFNGYLVALAKSGQVDKAEAVLEQMKSLYESGELKERPSVIAYSTVLDAFSKSRVEGAAGRAERILRQMIHEGVAPNSTSYNSVINAYTKGGNVDYAEKLLREMHERSSTEGNPDVKPTIQTYSVVLSGWSKLKSLQAVERAEQLFLLMKEMAQAGELEKPDIVVYNTLIDCLAKSQTKEGISKAKSFLQSMTQDGIAPDSISYNSLIASLARRGNVGEAEAMRNEMIAAGLSADVTTYNCLMDAWCRSNHPKAPQRIAELFSIMKESDTTQPDLVSFNTLMNFYSKRGEAERAEALLNELRLENSTVTPDVISFHTAMTAWSKSGAARAPERTEELLQQLLDTPKLRVESIAFNIAMGARIKSRSPHAMQHCQVLYEKMRDLGIQPDLVTYGILIQSCTLSTAEDAPDRAEAVLAELQRSRHIANSKIYGAMVNVWSRSHRPEAGPKAEEYLRAGVKLAANNVRESPRVYEYTAAIRTWARSGPPDTALVKADELFHLLLQDVERGNKSAKPDEKLFGWLLRLVVKSQRPNKAECADRLVALMVEHEVPPNRWILDLLQDCYADSSTTLSNTTDTTSSVQRHSV